LAYTIDQWNKVNGYPDPDPDPSSPDKSTNREVIYRVAGSCADLAKAHWNVAIPTPIYNIRTSGLPTVYFQATDLAFFPNQIFQSSNNAFLSFRSAPAVADVAPILEASWPSSIAWTEPFFDVGIGPTQPSPGIPATPWLLPPSGPPAPFTIPSTSICEAGAGFAIANTGSFATMTISRTVDVSQLLGSAGVVQGTIDVSVNEVSAGGVFNDGVGLEVSGKLRSGATLSSQRVFPGGRGLAGTFNRMTIPFSYVSVGDPITTLTLTVRFQNMTAKAVCLHSSYLILKTANGRQDDPRSLYERLSGRFPIIGWGVAENDSPGFPNVSLFAYNGFNATVTGKELPDYLAALKAAGMMRLAWVTQPAVDFKILNSWENYKSSINHYAPGGATDLTNILGLLINDEVTESLTLGNKGVADASLGAVTDNIKGLTTYARQTVSLPLWMGFGDKTWAGVLAYLYDAVYTDLGYPQDPAKFSGDALLTVGGVDGRAPTLFTLQTHSLPSSPMSFAHAFQNSMLAIIAGGRGLVFFGNCQDRTLAVAAATQPGCAPSTRSNLFEVARRVRALSDILIGQNQPYADAYDRLLFPLQSRFKNNLGTSTRYICKAADMNQDGNPEEYCIVSNVGKAPQSIMLPVLAGLNPAVSFKAYKVFDLFGAAASPAPAAACSMDQKNPTACVVADNPDLHYNVPISIGPNETKVLMIMFDRDEDYSATLSATR